MSRRTARIASELQSELARLLRQEVTDPRVGLVTLTRVDVAPDLSNAVVFWSALDVDGDPERQSQHQAGLESAAQFLRHRAAGQLPFKRMPALRFRYDPSLQLGSETLSLLRDVAPTVPDDDAPGDSAPDTETATATGTGAGEGEDGA